MLPNVISGGEFSGTCDHCAGAIQFARRDAGQTAQCPHCGQITFLRPTARKAGPPLIVTSLVIALVAGTAGFLFQKYKAGRVQTTPQPTQAQSQSSPDETAPPSAAEVDLPVISGFKASKVTFQKMPNSKLVYATGTLANIFDRQRFGVRLELDILDKTGKKVGSATDYVNVVEPKATWSYRALVTGTAAASAEIKAITENY